MQFFAKLADFQVQPLVSALNHIYLRRDRNLTKSKENFSTDLNLLNIEEITKLKSFLKTIQDDGGCSLARQESSGKTLGNDSYFVFF